MPGFQEVMPTKLLLFYNKVYYCKQAATYLILEKLTQKEGGSIMGDKGGKKNKEKQNKQANRAKNLKKEANKKKQEKTR